jgi:autotransporter-associated beta strand protein
MPLWNNNSGEWQTGANWVGGVPANGVGATAEFVNQTNGGFVQVGILENTTMTVGVLNMTLTGTTDLTIRGSLNDSGAGFGTLLFNNGSVNGNAIVTVNTAVGGGEFEISGFGGLRVDLGQATDFSIVNAGTLARVNAQIIGDGVLVKEGDGILSLGSNNSAWTGGILILDGILQATSASGALGTGNMSINGGALRAAFTVSNIMSVGLSGGSILAPTGSSLTLTGSLQNQFASILTFGSAGDAGTIIANNNSNVGFASSAGINIAGGTVRIENSDVAYRLLNRIAGPGLTEIQSGATLDTRGFETTISNLDLDGGTIRTSTGALNLDIYDHVNGVTAQSGTIEGTAGIDQIQIDVDTGFSLNGVTFSNWTAGTDIIGIQGSDAHNGITGSNQRDSIGGGGGNDTIFGNGGIDIINGADGNDIIILNAANSGSQVIGGDGTDTLRIISGPVQLNRNVFNTGFEAIELTGGARLDLTNYQYENTFADGTSIAGNGTLEIDLDFIDDSFIGARMTVEAGSTISTVINGADYSAGSDIIKGIRGAANTIHGNAGIDLLVGGDLRDVIDGGSEGDKIRGNGGADLLTGGAGADVFKYRAISESGLGANADTITDFLSGTDRLNFGRIDADANSAGDQAFTFVGTGAFTGGGVGSIRYSDLGNDLRVEADVNGDGVADMHVLLQGAGLQTLTATDFVL